jgi:hypothetical protein
MSRSRYCGYPREKTIKFFGKRTGYYGESCYAQEGVKFLKRQLRRANRRWSKNLNNLLQDLEN